MVQENIANGLTAAETLADVMDILKDLYQDIKPKGGRLREKLLLQKAFERYEKHRESLTRKSSPKTDQLADVLHCTDTPRVVAYQEMLMHAQRLERAQ